LVDREATSRAFGLLGRVFEVGFTPDVWVRLGEAGDPIRRVGNEPRGSSPQGARTAQETARASSTRAAGETARASSARAAGETARTAEETARHEEVLGYAVLPYAGVFLDPDAQIGGESETELVHARLEAGMPPLQGGGPPEHIAAEARLLSGLVLSSAHDCITSRLISDHLLAWLPALTHALREHGATDYAEAGDLLIELAVVFMEASRPADANPALFPTDIPTRTKSASVKDIAGHLVVHARTGMFLGRTVIAGIARGADSPRGFGGSALMLGNLLKSAAHFETLDRVTGALERTVFSYRNMWQARASRHRVLRAWSEVWQERQAGTLSLLSDIREGLTLAKDPSPEE
jgi:TorA maturation chaperone TorD